MRAAPAPSPGQAGAAASRTSTSAGSMAASRRRKLVLGSPLPQPFGKRLAVQLLTLALVVLAGFQFADWVSHLERGQIAGTRPPSVEGFLPISALISLRHLLLTGEFSLVHPAGLVLLVLIVLTGLLLKKAFCSWLCPVGVPAEWLARLSFKIFKRRIKLPAWVDYPLMGLKYLLLFFFVHAIFFRMTPTDVAEFINIPYNKVADIKMLYFFTHISALALQIILALIALSFAVPYFWCRYLCPYGALLGIASLFSPLKIRRSPPDCTSCGKCAAVCPAFISVDRKLSVSSPECTGCLECVVNCPEKKALAVQTPRPWRRSLRPALFGVLVALLFYGGIGMAKITGRWESNVSRQELMMRVQQGLDGPEYEHFGR